MLTTLNPRTLVVIRHWVYTDWSGRTAPVGARLAFESADGERDYFGLVFPDTAEARAFYLANPHRALVGTTDPVPPELVA